MHLSDLCVDIAGLAEVSNLAWTMKWKLPKPKLVSFGHAEPKVKTEKAILSKSLSLCDGVIVTVTFKCPPPESTVWTVPDLCLHTEAGLSDWAVDTSRDSGLGGQRPTWPWALCAVSLKNGIRLWLERCVLVPEGSWFSFSHKISLYLGPFISPSTPTTALQHDLLQRQSYWAVPATSHRCWLKSLACILVTILYRVHDHMVWIKG